ncbi:CBASS system CD-NTase-associated NAD(+) hydrolase Cap12 [Siphonobacter aquaeclarae]|uniref:CD-NTase-associated protein 12 n=1 Tax=Siphonobacter aquaeclarae TaxID=563176 RepID=A0A1G9I862_9BACT|nr:STING domain-containing protein [Siphonobacter aquaeclarae]SDL21245.1 Predicted nucleotide-binding protein containing TIR-like domain-containing protein [Siphonobacter aquaeclarae]
MKKRLFIGSSSEELELAHAAKLLLEQDFDVTIWNDTVWDSAVFRINQNFLSDLLKASLKFDFGILIGSKDDKVEYRGTSALQPRDNILFELGLFLGRLGPNKCAFLIEKDIKVLSDVQGITLARFDKSKPAEFNQAVIRIRDAFNSSSNNDINFFPSATLAAVYFENLVAPTCKFLIKNKGYKLNGIQYEKFKLKIIIPDKIVVDPNIAFEKIKSKLSTTKIDIDYSGRPRSIHHETIIKDNIIEFIDFPTIITGINFAISNLLPSEFNDLTSDYNLIVERELEKFILTLKQLLLRNNFDEDVEIIREGTFNKNGANV